MPIQVNPLTLQDLFFDMLEDLERTQNLLYDDEVSKQMNIYCMKKRMEYKRRLDKLMEQNR